MESTAHEPQPPALPTIRHDGCTDEEIAILEADRARQRDVWREADEQQRDAWFELLRADCSEDEQFVISRGRGNAASETPSSFGDHSAAASTRPTRPPRRFAVMADRRGHR